MKSFRQYMLEGSRGIQKAKRRENAAAKKFISATLKVGGRDEAIADAEEAALKEKERLAQIQAIRKPRVERAALRFAQAERNPRDLNYDDRDIKTDTELNKSRFEDGEISKSDLKIAKAEREKKKKEAEANARQERIKTLLAQKKKKIVETAQPWPKGHPCYGKSVGGCKHDEGTGITLIPGENKKPEKEKKTDKLLGVVFSDGANNNRRIR